MPEILIWTEKFSTPPENSQHPPPPRKKKKSQSLPPCLKKNYQPPLKVSEPPLKISQPQTRKSQPLPKNLNLLKYVSSYHPPSVFFCTSSVFKNNNKFPGGGVSIQHVTPLKISQPPPLKISQPLPEKCHPAKIC